MKRLILLLALLPALAVAAAAQGPGSSVFIYNTTPAGSEAGAVADYLAGQIGKGLLDRYPCVDWIDNQGLAAILDLERQRQLLGEEPDEEKLLNVAGALGAGYLVVVSSTALPDGRTAVSAKVVDGRTGRAVANRMEIGASAEAALDQAEAVAGKLMDDLADVFKNRCLPHWTGTIAYTLKYQKGETKETDGTPGAMESGVKVQVSWSDALENTIEARLQPMARGAEGPKTMALVSHLFDYRYTRESTRTGTIRCRPPNRPSYLRQTSGSSRELIEEYGHRTETLPVSIYLDKSTGKYELSVDFPAVAVKRSEERGGVKSGCQNEPFSEIKSGEGAPEFEAFRQSGFFKVSGRIDPQNPNVLAGRETTGDLENGLSTIKWNLRFVDPRPKKQGRRAGAADGR